jgi:hypothetical protein
MLPKDRLLSLHGFAGERRPDTDAFHGLNLITIEPGGILHTRQVNTRRHQVNEVAGMFSSGLLPLIGICFLTLRG